MISNYQQLLAGIAKVSELDDYILATDAFIKDQDSLNDAYPSDIEVAIEAISERDRAYHKLETLRKEIDAYCLRAIVNYRE